MPFLPKHGLTVRSRVRGYSSGRDPHGRGWVGEQKPTGETPHPTPELSASVPTQVRDGEGRAGHARAAVRAPRFPGHRCPLDEAAGFLPETQTHQQPPRPLWTCKYQR